MADELDYSAVEQEMLQELENEDLAPELAFEQHATKAQLFKNLGLDHLRGQGMCTRIKKHLRVPGQSIRLSTVLTQADRRQIVTVAHGLLYTEGWGTLYLNSPSVHVKGVRKLVYNQDPQEALMNFSSLLYLMAMSERARRNPAPVVEIEPPSAAVPVPIPVPAAAAAAAATTAAAEYSSPQQVANNNNETAPKAVRGRKRKRASRLAAAEAQGEAPQKPPEEGSAGRSRQGENGQSVSGGLTSSFESVVDLCDDHNDLPSAHVAHQQGDVSASAGSAAAGQAMNEVPNRPHEPQGPSAADWAQWDQVLVSFLEKMGPVQQVTIEQVGDFLVHQHIRYSRRQL